MFSSLKKWFSVTSLDQQPQLSLLGTSAGMKTAAFSQSPAGWRPSSQGAFGPWNGIGLMILCVQRCAIVEWLGQACLQLKATTRNSVLLHPAVDGCPTSVCHVCVVIAVNVLKTPNERRVGGGARLLRGVWPQKVLWRWLPSSGPNPFCPQRGVQENILAVSN